MPLYRLAQLAGGCTLIRCLISARPSMSIDSPSKRTVESVYAHVSAAWFSQPTRNGLGDIHSGQPEGSQHFVPRRMSNELLWNTKTSDRHSLRDFVPPA